MSSDILNEGLNLMAFGMGAVFAFLTLLVIITSIMSAVISRFFPVTLPEAGSSMAPRTSGVDPQIVSAIMAAIKLHRSRKK